jgi:hypothetical protein
MMAATLKEFYFIKNVPGNPESVQVMCSYGDNGGKYIKDTNVHEICIIDTKGAGDRAYSEWVAQVLIAALIEEQDIDLGEELETYEAIS